MKTDASGKTRVSTNALIAWSLGFAVCLIVALSLVAASGHADPTDVSPGSQSIITSIVNASVIVFREGLEAVLIFAAITASFLGARQGYRKPVVIGVASAFVATVLTWFLMTSVVGALPLSEDVLLAMTGIIAVVVLLLVMNWFFHKVYWTDHIKELNAKKRSLVTTSESGEQVKYWGFVALGFTAVYREGFEVVLFLQNLNLVAGGKAVFFGTLIGLAATTIVGYLTFFLHHKLPYKRMLVLTGVLLGLVLVVMVGGSARTLQDLGVLSTSPLPMAFPDWWARWFEVVPTYETLTIQLLAGAFVVGSYYAAEWWSKEKRRRMRGGEPLCVETPAIPIPALTPSVSVLRQATTPASASYATTLRSHTITVPEAVQLAVRTLPPITLTAPQPATADAPQSSPSVQATRPAAASASPVATFHAASTPAASIDQPAVADTPSPIAGRPAPLAGSRVSFSPRD